MMRIKAVIYEEESGDYWAKLPARPDRPITGATFRELLNNIYVAAKETGYAPEKKWPAGLSGRRVIEVVLPS